MDGLQRKRGDTEEQDSRRPFLRKEDAQSPDPESRECGLARGTPSAGQYPRPGPVRRRKPKRHHAPTLVRLGGDAPIHPDQQEISRRRRGYVDVLRVNRVDGVLHTRLHVRLFEVGIEVGRDLLK